MAFCAPSPALAYVPLQAALEPPTPTSRRRRRTAITVSSTRSFRTLLRILLKSRRQVLHRRVAEIYATASRIRRRPNRKGWAHHFTQAGLTRDAAIEWWARPATRRYAAPPFRRRSRISARPSRWRTRLSRRRRARRRRQAPATSSTSQRLKLRPSLWPRRPAVKGLCR